MHFSLHTNMIYTEVNDTDVNFSSIRINLVEERESGSQKYDQISKQQQLQCPKCRSKYHSLLNRWLSWEHAKA